MFHTVLRKQICRNTWYTWHPRGLKKHQHTQHFFSGAHPLYSLLQCSYANVTLGLIHSVMLKTVHPPIFTQPKDDITHFAKYLIKKVYTSHRPLVRLSPFLRLLLLKLLNYSVPASVTSSEREILLLFLMSGQKREKVLFISAFHPGVSCCSPAASTITPEHASGRAPALWQYIHQGEWLNHQAEVCSSTFKCAVARPEILNFLGLLILIKFKKILHKSTQEKLSGTKLIFWVPYVNPS